MWDFQEWKFINIYLSSITFLGGRHLDEMVIIFWPIGVGGFGGISRIINGSGVGILGGCWRIISGGGGVEFISCLIIISPGVGVGGCRYLFKKTIYQKKL